MVRVACSATTARQTPWRRPMGPFKTTSAAGSFPSWPATGCFLCQDHDQNRSWMALDNAAARPLEDRPLRVPARFLHAGDLGRRGASRSLWPARCAWRAMTWKPARKSGRFHGICGTVCMTPVVGDDGRLYVAGWSAGRDAAHDQGRALRYRSQAPGQERQRQVWRPTS